jgi:DNA-binding MarR family transcriptional regulator
VPHEESQWRFAWVPSAVFIDPVLRDRELRVALLIGSLSPTKRQLSWAPQEWLAFRLGIDVRWLRRHLKNLEDRGHMGVIREEGRTNRYRLKVSRRLRKVPPWGAVPSSAMDDPRVTPSARRVLGLTCCFADREGYTFVSQTTLARHLRMNSRTVERARRLLVANQYLEKTNERAGWQVGDGRRRPTTPGISDRAGPRASATGY